MGCALSIIVPLYNAKAYIGQCLESLLSQTLSDIEIVVVDDCGPDGSLQCVEKIKQEHPLGEKIVILKMPQNQGAAMARNRGIQEAQGEYVAFVDADDWVEKTMFESLYTAAKKYQADWSYCNAVKEFSNGSSQIICSKELASGQLSEEAKKEMLVSGVAYFWTGIYKRQFLEQHSIAFPNYKFSEDSFFVWKVVLNAQKIAYTPLNGYHYRIIESSVSNRPDSKKASLKQALFSFLIEDLKLQGLYPTYKEELDFLYYKKGVLIPYIILLTSGLKRDASYKDILWSLKKEMKRLQKNSYLKKSLKWRMVSWLLLFFPFVVQLFYPIIRKKVVL